MTARVRSRSVYRLVLLLPLAMLGYVVASGRAAASWRLIVPLGGRSPVSPNAMEFESAFGMSVLWIVSLAPLLLAAWEIGREHVTARRFDAEILFGLREVVRRALGLEPASTDSAEFTRPPKDNPRVALLFALGPAILVPVFFASALPMLRTPRGLVWLVGAGVIMGSLVYTRFRAMAYLRDEPGRFDVFRQYRLMNPNRYEEQGHPFVRWQIYGTILLGIWWLGGGALVLLPS